MFSHFISHSPTVTHKGYKVLMGGPILHSQEAMHPLVAFTGIPRGCCRAEHSKQSTA